MAGGRKLRLLVINDQKVSIGSDQIEIVECPIKSSSGKNIPRLANWPQHMYLWGTGSVPEFDLLLVDIKFEKDTYDPYYFYERESKDKNIINPFGLLHALPLAARQDLTNMPFVWGVHSGEPSAVKDDPVAILAFGLLCAMERRPGWNQYKSKRQIPDYFSKQIDSLQALDANAAWIELVDRYRNRLQEACEKGRLQVEIEGLNDLIGEIENTYDSEFKKLDGDILFYAGRQGDTLSLRSLFADFKTWDASIKENVLKFLKGLKEAEKQANIYPRVASIIEQLRSGDKRANLTLSGILDAKSEDKARKAMTAVGVITCLWLERYYFDRYRKTRELLADMGYLQKNNYQQPNRYLEYSRNISPLGRFLKTLETRRSLDPTLRECGRHYWRDVLKKQSGGKNKDWPPCLQEDGSDFD
jgi:hypothetical protein